MKVAIFGGTGAIGRHTVEQALEAGHTVRAFARDASRLPQHERLESIEGTIEDETAIASVLAGCDAVIDALAPQSNSRAEMEHVVDAIRRILQAAERAGVRRIVMLSGAAVSVPGERKNIADAIASRFVRLFARWVVETRQRELELLRASRLEWIASGRHASMTGRSSGAIGQGAFRWARGHASPGRISRTSWCRS